MTTLFTAPFVTQLEDEIEYGDKGMFRKHLVRDKKWQAMLICLEAGIQIPEHISSHNGCITIIQGRGVFTLAGQAVALEPGVFIELPANTLHALTVTEDLALLKVVDAHDVETAPKKPSCQEPRYDNQPKQATCAETLAAMLKPYLQNAAPADATVRDLQINAVLEA